MAARDFERLTPGQQRLVLQRLRQARKAPTAAFMSRAQRRIWLLERLSPGNPAHHLTFGIRIRGTLDRRALGSALDGIIRRHEWLRTVFPAEGVAEVRDPFPFPLEDAEGDIECHVAELGRQLYDLAQGPLIRGRLLKAADQDPLLVIGVHHIVFDATSTAVFVRDLATAYRSAPLPPLPPLPREPALRDDHLAFWAGLLKDSPVLSTLPGGSGTGERHGSHQFRFPAEVVDRARALGRNSGATLYAALLAAHALVLYRASGQKTILVGAPVSTRPSSEVIGCFFSPQVMRIDLDGDPTLREVVKRAHAAIGQAHRYQNVGFWEIVEAVRPNRAPGRNPLFQTMVSLVEYGHLGDSAFTLESLPPGGTDLDMYLATTLHREGHLQAICLFDGALFGLDDITGMIASLRETLALLCDAPDQLLSAAIPRVGTASAPAWEASAYRPPGTETELLLAGIWSEVLGIADIGIDDDFFCLGGDSMQVVQVIVRAAEAGLALRPYDLMTEPTVAALARHAGGKRPSQPADQGPVTGPVPLTPAQLWFLLDVAPHMSRPEHYNHAYYLEIADEIAAGVFRQAVDALVTHHDALRLSLEADHTTDRASGSSACPPIGWRQSCGPPGTPVPFSEHDLSGIPASEQNERVDRIAACEQTRMSFRDGMVRAIHFRLRPAQADRFLLICQHLVVDGMSRPTILEDLRTAVRQISQGQPLRLPPKTTSFQHWAECLQSYAQTEDLQRQLPFWRRQAQPEPIPVDLPGTPRFGNWSIIWRILSAEQTTSLVAGARSIGAGPGDLLLTAIAQTIAGWTGTSKCALSLSASGREPLMPEVDVSQTVGWFQISYPLVIGIDPAAPLLLAVPRVRRQVAAVPQHGIGHGLLKRQHADLTLLPQPQMSYNYMGQLGFESTGRAADLFTVADASFGRAQDPEGVRPHLIDFHGSLTGGRLRLRIDYSSTVHHTQTIESLADGVVARLLKEK
jgi:non-ribosomal peptide synthase protein (TIGR01720 family)